ncbi:protein TolR [Formicincola oecophyllae]|uniref:Protein TolR n=1 Tax=Formicincola oecophyllae TaxID=2558361 RepID=A0A4Y6UBD8_9PROT|nr:protein TolR [Formicincola oecophyllae]QDH13777.1 protein TolR [Formicincola oecophyllae]
MAIGQKRARRRPEAAINVTPLVDVMLVLLIIFMVAAPMMTSGISVDLPKASAKPLNTDTKPITVSMKSDGSVWIGDAPISEDALVSRLLTDSHNDTSRRVFVRADAKIDYGQVMKLMGVITSGGFTHVALLAQAQSEH